MLDIMLALDCIPDRLEFFEVDECLQPMPSRKALYKPRPVFEYAADKIVCHADIEDAVRSVGHEVNVATCHAGILQDVDGRDKPGHDDGIGSWFTYARAVFFRYARCTAQLQPGGCEATSLAGAVVAGGCVGIASFTRRSCAD
jgi:hypothetical protein